MTSNLPTVSVIDEYDVAAQGLISHHIETVDGELRRFSVPFRYVWPAELDLMAEMAGMRLSDRYEGWRGEPFTSGSAGMYQRGARFEVEAVMDPPGGAPRVSGV